MNITREMFVDEFIKGQRKYENDNRTHKFDHMDLQTFMWNMYEENIRKLREKQAMWSKEIIQKYLKEEEK